MSPVDSDAANILVQNGATEPPPANPADPTALWLQFYLSRQITTARRRRQHAGCGAEGLRAREDRKQALAAGYQMHIAKPIGAGQLVNMIAKLAGREN